MNSANRVSAPSVERNKLSILEVLKQYLKDEKRVLEVGSGTGEHAVFFANNFSRCSWQPTDVSENLEVIEEWMADQKHSNISKPIEFEIGSSSFPNGEYDMVFTANTFHIISWEKVKTLIELLGNHLKNNALVAIYGPFNYQGLYTSASNENFDQWLKERDPLSAIRSFEDVCEHFLKQEFSLFADHEMPANNRTLMFIKDKS